MHNLDAKAVTSKACALKLSKLNEEFGSQRQLALALKMIKYFRKDHNFEKLSLTECSNLMMDD